MINEELFEERLNEELESSDFDALRSFIRREIALIFFDLFKKRSVWSK